MRVMALLVARDLRQAWQSAGLWLPVAFLLLVASLYPFAVGPDAALLRRSGGGMLWIAALLASLLPVDRLVTPDRDAGVLDQIALRGVGDEVMMLARLIALPLAVPLLIFGAGTLGDGSGAALKFLGAASVLLVAITPFGAGAAIRAGRE